MRQKKKSSINIPCGVPKMKTFLVWNRTATKRHFHLCRFCFGLSSLKTLQALVKRTVTVITSPVTAPSRCVLPPLTQHAGFHRHPTSAQAGRAGLVWAEPAELSTRRAAILPPAMPFVPPAQISTLVRLCWSCLA